MSQFWNSIREVKKNYKTYDAWEQDQADDAARREYLSKTVDIPKDRAELTKQKAKVVLRAADLMDKRSEDNAQNMERTFNIVTLGVIFSISPLFQLIKKSIPKIKETKFQLIQLATIAASGIGLSLFGAKKQKEASRIGRFQAKQHELKDIKNFVIYTPEQIEAAKILSKQIQNTKDNKSLSKMFEDAKQISKDKKAYKKWLEEKIDNKEDIKKLLNTDFTPKQIEQGKQDKELVTNIIKDVNIKAEEYSENTENAFDTIGSISVLGTMPLAYGLYKILDKFKNISPKMKARVSVLSYFIFNIGLIAWGTSEKKQASRVGRYVKTQEIMKNPNTLVGYSDEQMQQAEHIEAEKQKKSFMGGIFDDFKFLNQYVKDKKAYNSHKSIQKQEEKLYEALKKSEVSENQLKDAKNLQEKTFMTFDKVDEMSQRYSEDIEAGTEIAKQGVSLSWGIVSVVGFGFLAALGKKGRLPIHKLLKGVSNISLNKQSSVKKLVDEAYTIIKTDKNLKREFNKAIFSEKSRKILLNNAELSPILAELGIKAFNKLPEIIKEENPIPVIKKILNKHFKQDPFSKWVRSFSVDIAKIWIKKKKNIELPKEAEEQLKLNLIKNYKNHKTFWNTLGIACLPFLGIFVSVPFAFNSWMTNVQKKAGRIGVMQAVNDLDNPKLFIDKEDKSDKNS